MNTQLLRLVYYTIILFAFNLDMCLCVFICVYMGLCLFICFMWVFVCLYGFMCVYMGLCGFICVYVCLYVYG